MVFQWLRLLYILIPRKWLFMQRYCFSVYLPKKKLTRNIEYRFQAPSNILYFYKTHFFLELFSVQTVAESAYTKVTCSLTHFKVKRERENTTANIV